MVEEADALSFNYFQMVSRLGNLTLAESWSVRFVMCPVYFQVLVSGCSRRDRWRFRSGLIFGSTGAVAAGGGLSQLQAETFSWSERREADP